MGVRIESQFWESPFFGLLQQINQVLLILTIFACWFIFLKELLLWFVHDMYTGLSNGDRITTVAWWFDQFPYIVRRNAASGARTDL